jgi:PAS domain S-box-containing protein
MSPALGVQGLPRLDANLIMLLMAGGYEHLSRPELIRLLEAHSAGQPQASEGGATAQEAERYRNLIENAADGIFLLDEGGVCRDVNECGLQLLGMRREEVVGARVRNLILEEDLPAHEAAWAVLMRGQPFLGERRLKRKDGSTILIEVNARRLSNGQVQGILRDLSHRQRAEQELRQREERFRKLTAAAFEGIGISENGKVIDVNDQLAQLFGYTRDELVGQDVMVMIAPESRALVAKMMRAGKEGPYEHLAIRKDGAVFEAEVRAKAILWGGRNVRVTAIRDITERKRAALALHGQLAFNELLNHVLSRFATCPAAEADAAVVEALAGIAKFIGADHAYVVLIAPDRTAWGATHEWCAPHVTPQFDNYQQVPLGTKPWSEARVLAGENIRLNSIAEYPPEAAVERRVDAAEGALSILSVPIRGQARQLTGCVGLHSHAHPIAWSDTDAARLKMVGDAIANVLERKRVEDSLREVSHRLHRSQDEERRKLARELHDSTAQLLAAAMMNLGTLEDEGVRKTEKGGRLVFESLELIERCSQEVRTLSHLLHPPLLDHMGLESALRAYVDGFAGRSGLKVSIKVALGRERLPEEAELTLFRVVQEGLGNIHRHSGSLTARISLRRKPPGIVLEVADQGLGMPTKILQAFQNGGVTTGVGLAAMQERLREIGGSLTVESSPAGTCLRAVVPLKANRE